jgi:hypothetical protein
MSKKKSDGRRNNGKAQLKINDAKVLVRGPAALIAAVASKGAETGLTQAESWRAAATLFTSRDFDAPA